MGQINTLNLPQYLADTRPANLVNNSSETAAGTPPQNAARQDDSRLTRLGSVLSTVKNGATTVRKQVSQIMGSVRNGTYEVDPLQVSRSIVGDSLMER